jgi:8-oxo-dGTP diphosphatase
MKAAHIIDQIYEELASIIPCDSREQEHLADAGSWIKSGANIFRIVKPDKPPKHLVSYFVVIDPVHRSLLLGNHIKAQLWLPTGGHVKLYEHPREAVLREAKEELQMSAQFLHGRDKPFFITINETGGLTPGHTDVSLWYLVRGDIHASLTYNRQEFTDMNWFSFDEILESHPAIFDRHMHRFTHKLLETILSPL